MLIISGLSLPQSLHIACAAPDTEILRPNAAGNVNNLDSYPEETRALNYNTVGEISNTSRVSGQHVKALLKTLIQAGYVRQASEE